MICTTEVEVLDTMKTKLSSLVSAGLAIAHATLDKAQTREKDIQKYEDKIALIENEGRYYKSTRNDHKFIEYALDENEASAKVKRNFIR
jgi:hypothetical protein